MDSQRIPHESNDGRPARARRPAADRDADLGADEGRAQRLGHPDLVRGPGHDGHPPQQTRLHRMAGRARGRHDGRPGDDHRLRGVDGRVRADPLPVRLGHGPHGLHVRRAIAELLVAVPPEALP